MKTDIKPTYEDMKNLAFKIACDVGFYSENGILSGELEKLMERGKEWRAMMEAARKNIKEHCETHEKRD